MGASDIEATSVVVSNSHRSVRTVRAISLCTSGSFYEVVMCIQSHLWTQRAPERVHPVNRSLSEDTVVCTRGAKRGRPVVHTPTPCPKRPICQRTTMSEVAAACARGTRRAVCDQCVGDNHVRKCDRIHGTVFMRQPGLRTWSCGDTVPSSDMAIGSSI